MKRSNHGWGRIAMLVAAAIALSVGVSVGLASSGSNQIRASLYKSTFCPKAGSKLKALVGTARIVNEKGDLTILVTLRGAQPGHYHLELWDSECYPIDTDLGLFKVDAKGSGEDQTPFEAPGVHRLFVWAGNMDVEWGAGSTLLTLPG